MKDSRRCRWRRVRGACGDRGALAQRGAKVDQLSANDLSPLMLAVKMNNKANVEALLAAGASVSLSNKAGYTAIGYSRAGEVRQLLLAQHAELKGAGRAYGAKRTAVLC